MLFEMDIFTQFRFISWIQLISPVACLFWFGSGDYFMHNILWELTLSLWQGEELQDRNHLVSPQNNEKILFRSRRIDGNIFHFLGPPCSWDRFSVMQEFTDRLDVPTMACIPTQDHGLRKVESIIAAILIFVQISSPLPIVAWDSMSISPAKAVLYSPDTKVPRTGELALRKAIPANTNMKAIQVVDDNWFCLYFSNLY